MAMTFPPPGGRPSFDFAAFRAAVSTEIKSMRCARRIENVAQIARRIIAICESTGVVCNEFGDYKHGTREDIVNRVCWLAREYEYCFTAIKEQPARLEKLISCEVVH